jgi:hypothetical protein
MTVFYFKGLIFGFAAPIVFISFAAIFFIILCKANAGGFQFTTTIKLPYAYAEGCKSINVKK